MRGLSSATGEFGLTDCLQDMSVARESVWPTFIFHLQLMSVSNVDCNLLLIQFNNYIALTRAV